MPVQTDTSGALSDCLDGPDMTHVWAGLTVAFAMFFDSLVFVCVVCESNELYYYD